MMLRSTPTSYSHITVHALPCAVPCGDAEGLYGGDAWASVLFAECDLGPSVAFSSPFVNPADRGRNAAVMERSVPERGHGGSGNMSQMVREKCIRRESNPGNKLGRLES